MTRTENHGGSVPRYLAILVAAVLGLSLFPAAAFAAHNDGDEDPCADAPVANEYVDRDEAREVHRESIDCVIYLSIALGTSNDAGEPIYDPLSRVTRGQMASFIYNTLDAAGYAAELPSRDEPHEFTDIAGNAAAGNINALARAGIVRGVTDDTYAPNELIRRDQMASFMVQAANWAVGTEDEGARVDDHPVVSDGTDRFLDVEADNPHKGNIEAGADAGLFAGTSTTTFDPEVRVRRDQMATFLVNLLQYIFNVGTAPPPTEVEVDVDVAQSGDTITGTIDGADSATVSGCGFDDETVVDTDGDDDNDTIEFELTIPEDQEPGECTLRFEIVRPNGQVVRRNVTITVEGAPAEQQTVAPELISAEFVREFTTGGGGIVVRYCFDEDVIAAIGAADLFQLYQPRNPNTPEQGDTAEREAGETSDCVLVTFDTLDEEAFDSFSVATVDPAAVQDSDGNENPEGDTAVGEGTQFAEGETLAPDLLTIGGFGPGTDDPVNGVTTTTVVFTFDEEAFVVDANGFDLILDDGTEIDCFAVQDEDAADPTTNFEGDGTTAITTECENLTGNEQITAEDVARGTVVEGTVSDEDPFDDAGAATGNTGSVNPLQATNDKTASSLPDLVDAIVNDDNTVTYVFDEDVDSAAIVFGEFRVYDFNGEEFVATGVDPDSETGDGEDDDEVTVTFAAGDLNEVIGASVADGAVTELGAGGGRPNEQDEVGVGAFGFEAGATVAPDLTAVTTEVTGTETNPQGETEETEITVTYVFDDDVDAVAGGFFIYDAENNRTELLDCTAGTADPDDDIEDNEVACLVDVNDATDTDAADAEAGFTEAGEAVLGTVQNGAVTDDAGNANPEGAEPVEAA